MCDGILCEKAVWRFAVGLRVYIFGAMNGTVSQTMIKKRWRNASAYLQVRVFLSYTFIFAPHACPCVIQGILKLKIFAGLLMVRE